MPKRKKTILIIDDEPDIRILFGEELGQRYKILTAKDGEEGLKSIFEKKPDLVILDIKMPKMNGLEVLRKSKSFFPSLPIILCSAFSSYKTVYAASLADAFVVKSPDFTELNETIEHLLSQ
jgi:DNA-binding NtrC family response regulator